MTLRSISKNDVIFDLPDSKIPHVPIFSIFRPCLTFDRKVTVCHHVWIINDVSVKFKNWCHIWSPRLKSTKCTTFQRILTSFDIKVTVCHHIWINNWSISKNDVIFHLTDAKISHVPISSIFWPCLTGKWQYVIMYE